MQDQPDPVVWALLGVPVLGLVALALLRWVPTGHVLVVTRRGRVERVVPPGLTLRVPLSTSVLVPSSTDVALVARGTTREGIQVRMVVETDAAVVPPRRHEPYVDAVGTGTPAGERVLADVVGSATLRALPDHLGRSWQGLTVEVDRATSDHGLRVRSMRLVELDAVLAPDVTPDVTPAADGSR